MSKSCGHLSLRPTYRDQGGICTNCDMLCCPKCFYYENENGLYDELDGLCTECNEEHEELQQARKTSVQTKMKMRVSEEESFNDENEEEETPIRMKSTKAIKHIKQHPSPRAKRSESQSDDVSEEEIRQECPKCKKKKKAKRNTSKYLDFYCKQCKVGWRDLKDDSEDEDDSEHASDIEIMEEEEIQNPFEVMCEMKTGKIKVKVRLENKVSSLKAKLIDFIKKRDTSLQQYSNDSFKLICNNKVLIDEETIKNSRLNRYSILYIYFQC